MYKKTIEEVVNSLDTNIEKGLTSSEAKKRQGIYGTNELEKPQKRSLLLRFLDQFKDAMIIILIIAAVISIIVEPGDWIDSLIIVIVVMMNAILGVVLESHAEKSLESLQELSAPQSKVLRDGVKQTIASKELVPGDIIILETGDMIPSDARLIEAYNLKVDESALTGESVPVEKTTDPISQDVVIGDQTNMVFSSTVVTYGRGKAIVTSTGMKNEVGKIAGMLNESEKELTPLQVKLNEIGKTIGLLCIVICVIVFILESLSGISWLESFKTAVALAVAAVPEGLAATVTIVLAVSVTKMVKQHAIIRKLPAVETLGSTSIVCSDKTGTLTQNKMTILKTYLDGDEVKDLEEADSKTIDMLNAFTLCSDASIDDGKVLGDPTEVALVEASKKMNFEKKALMEKYPRVGELAFDSDRKMMSVIVKDGDHYVSITKGGPDVILNRCHDVDSKQAMTANDEMAKDALRVLAVAVKTYDTMPTNITVEEIENDMDFIGFVGMIDPARPEAKEAIRVAKHAGVRTIMITGDHKTTATAIAKDLGILSEGQEVISGEELSQMSQEELEKNVEKYSVYARVAPEHKVNIVKAWKSKNKIVAMTGDGVNDAPSIKTADIGVGMGITGTDVTKNVADMVLADDNFATIVEAIKQGRKVFANIQKAILYLMSCNVGEVLTVFMMTMLGWDILMPVQLLWINLVTDTLPAIALGVEPVEPGIMKKKPRGRKSNFFSGGVASSIIYQGILEGILVLGAYQFGLHVGPHVGNAAMQHADALTMAFLTLGLIQLFHAFNSKFIHKSIFRGQTFENKWFNGAIIISALVMAAVEIPFLTKIFDVTELDGMQWLVVIIAGLLMIIIVEIVKFFERRTARK